GWDKVREQRFRRQIELGIVPAETPLSPRNSEIDHDVRPWDELTADERRLFARYMEVYAGMVDSIDQSLGRLRSELERLGEWDNTLVMFTSDNGGSREGEEIGTSSYFRTLSYNMPDAVEEDLARIDLVGGPQSLAHYPRGWAMTSNTPYRLYKINTHAGGHSVPFVVSWPAAIPAELRGGLRTQYQHITDVFPTVLDLVGAEAPTHRRGRPTFEVQGSSLTSTIGDASAPSTHREQHYEMWGHRGFYRDGWEAVTCHQDATAFSDDRWELYDLVNDMTETVDLAASQPDKLAELIEAWERGARDNQVLPLDERTGLKFIQRPPWVDEMAEPVTLGPAAPQLERFRSLQLIDSRSFRVIIELTQPPGGAGTLVAHGDQGGGYGLYVIDGALHFIHNGYGVMTEVDGGPIDVGDHSVVLAVDAPGDGVWNAALEIDGLLRAEAGGLRMLNAMAPFQGIDVGIDRRSPVSWSLYERHGTFPFSGSVHAVRYEPGERAPDAGARWLDLLREMGSRYE
ncbi:MAG: sulfatase-like hydrolase/transferase, partial [Acidimicrobiia bacterium]|nr:sulfatase-like hydrolase/transferase [Acidimicrobiia bacterium]